MEQRPVYRAGFALDITLGAELDRSSPSMTKGMLLIAGLWVFPVAVFAMMRLGLISKRLADALNGLAILVSAVLFLLFAFFIYSDSGNTLNLPKSKGQYLDPSTPDFFVALTWLGWIAFCGYLAWAGASMLLAAFHNRQPNRLRNDSAVTGLKPPLDGHEYRKETVPTWLVLCVVALLGYAFVQGFLRIGA